jgi:hypothetical protein
VEKLKKSCNICGKSLDNLGKCTCGMDNFYENDLNFNDQKEHFKKLNRLQYKKGNKKLKF